MVFWSQFFWNFRAENFRWAFLKDGISTHCYQNPWETRNVCGQVSWSEVRLGWAWSSSVNAPELDPTILNHSSVILIFELGPRFEIQSPFSWNCSHSMGMCFLNIIFMNLKSAFQYPIQALSVLRREVTFHPIQLTIANSNKLILV